MCGSLFWDYLTPCVLFTGLECIVILIVEWTHTESDRCHLWPCSPNQRPDLSDAVLVQAAWAIHPHRLLWPSTGQYTAFHRRRRPVNIQTVSRSIVLLVIRGDNQEGEITSQWLYIVCNVWSNRAGQYTLGATMTLLPSTECASLKSRRSMGIWPSNY